MLCVGLLSSIASFDFILFSKKKKEKENKLLTNIKPCCIIIRKEYGSVFSFNTNHPVLHSLTE